MMLLVLRGQGWLLVMWVWLVVRVRRLWGRLILMVALQILWLLWMRRLMGVWLRGVLGLVRQLGLVGLVLWRCMRMWLRWV